MPVPDPLARRRSERVPICFSVEISGVDDFGRRFSEPAKTITVSRHGCALAAGRPLETGQPISLRRIGTNESVVGTIVYSLNKAGEQLYGVGTVDPCESMWGIQFSSRFFDRVIENAVEGVYFVNRDRRITSWNDGAERLTGYSAAEVVGRCCSENFLGHVDPCGRPLCATGCPLSRVLQDGQPRTAEFYVRHEQGHRVPISVRVMPMKNADGEVIGAVEIFRDARDERRHGDGIIQLEPLGSRDLLTKMPNQPSLQIKVEQALQEHERCERPYGLLLFDLDHFSQVNETYGHKIGDALLKAIAKALLASHKHAEMVARCGGEKFLVLAPDLEPAALQDFADCYRAMIAQSSVMSGRTSVSVTASIGATVLMRGDSAESAIRRAEELMQQSKRLGGNQATTG